MYWHCRTPMVTPYRFLMKAANPLPSQRPLVIPTDFGVWRSTELISCSCLSLSRRGRPERSPSTRPARPFSSKRRTQYSTVRGASPKSRPTSGQLNPWATSNTPWRRWSYRDSLERRISYDFKLGVRINGKYRFSYWDSHLAPVMDSSGTIRGFVMCCIDATERHLAKKALESRDEVVSYCSKLRRS